MQGVKIVGSVGRWSAEAGAETLPVLHAHWWNIRSGEYNDPMPGVLADPAKATKHAAYVALLAKVDRAIIQKDVEPVALRRDGYVGVFRFQDLSIGEDGSIRLKIVERLANARK